jgi:broad specificity phosphatase PhoE
MSKTLVLIRHGHRDNSRRELDNGLTEKGREQARLIRRFFNERFHDEDFKKGLWLVSSPKQRCQETLQPLAKSLERPLDIHPGLDEQGLREASGKFEERVLGFLREWATAGPPLTVLCSHGDWLPLAISRLLGMGVELKKGSWFELEEESGHAALRWYIPSFKHFFR